MRVVSSRHRQVPRVAVAFATVFLGACGDDDEGATDSTSAGSVESTAPTTTTVEPSTSVTSPGTSTTTNVTTTSPVTTTSTTVPEPEPVEWMPTGPGDPLIPRQYGGLLPQGNDSCDDLRRGPDGEVPGSFWDVARQVCLAITTGGEWPAVDVAPVPPEADGPFATCLDHDVRGVIDAALEWHRRHPDRQPVVSYAPAGALSACEREIYALRAVLVGEQDFSGGSVGDVRIEFEIPSRPDLEVGQITTEVDGQLVSLQLDGVDPDRGTRRGRIVLGNEWADGRTATIVLRSPAIDRSGAVELPRGEATPSTTDEEQLPDVPPTTT